MVQLYTQPPADSLVICLDQHGPVSLHATQGDTYAAPGKTGHYDAEYKRHGTIYALGALLPHVGNAFVRAFTHYNSLTVIWFLGWLLPQLPDKRNIYPAFRTSRGRFLPPSSCGVGGGLVRRCRWSRGLQAGRAPGVAGR